MASDLDNNNPRANRAKRIRTYKKAIVKNDKIGGDKSVILRNISESGGLIELNEVGNLPTHFTIQVELDGFDVPAKMVRVDNTLVGVQFTGPRKSFNPTKKQTLNSLDDPLIMAQIKEHELKKQIYELRCSQTVNSSEDQNGSQDIFKTRKKGFGKR